MGIIDADAHVIEIDQTWEYMDPSERQYKPGVAFQTLESGEVLKYWIIGGRAIRTPWPGGGAEGDRCDQRGVQPSLPPDRPRDAQGVCQVR